MQMTGNCEDKITTETVYTMFYNGNADIVTEANL